MRILLGYLTLENTRDTLWGPQRLYRFKQTSAMRAADKTNVAKGQAGLAEGKALTGQMGTESGTLLPAYQSILKDPGYSAGDKSAITLNTLGGLGAAYGSESDAASNRMARTRNPAGFTASLDELARGRGRDTATAEAGLQEKFADTALSERDKALGGLGNLYGIDASTMAKLLTPEGINPNPPGAFTQAAAGALGKWLSPMSARPKA